MIISASHKGDLEAILKELNFFFSADSINTHFFGNYIFLSLESHSFLSTKLITNKDKSIVLLLNGDIFNVDNVANKYNISLNNFTTLESLLELYKNFDLDPFTKFNGSFNIIIYDVKNNKINIINDRYGSRKLYYLQKNDCFILSPKIRPITKVTGFQNVLRKDSIMDFFIFGYLLNDKTFFRDVHKLSSASITKISGGNIESRKYWDWKLNEKTSVTRTDDAVYADVIEELGFRLEHSIKNKIKNQNKVSIELSGGLDSRLVLGSISKYLEPQNILTCSYGVNDSYDYEIGNIVSDFLGTEHISLISDEDHFLKQLKMNLSTNEGMIEATPLFPIISYNKMIKERKRTVFSGFMGDNLMGSHISFMGLNLSNKYLNKELSTGKDLLSVKHLILNRQSISPFDKVSKIFNNKFTKEKYCSTSFAQSLKHNNHRKATNYFECWDFQQRQQNYINFTVIKSPETANYSFPFLDNDLVDFILKFPVEYRYKQKLYRDTLLKCYENLYKLPTKTKLNLPLDTSRFRYFTMRSQNKALRILNESVSYFFRGNIFQNRNKNYIEYDNFLRTNRDFYEIFSSLLEKIKKNKFFNGEYIEQLLKSHMNGQVDNYRILSSLITFELFLEEFVGNDYEIS